MFTRILLITYIIIIIIIISLKTFTIKESCGFKTAQPRFVKLLYNYCKILSNKIAQV